jgi:hypothetical protein
MTFKSQMTFLSKTIWYFFLQQYLLHKCYHVFLAGTPGILRCAPARARESHITPHNTTPSRVWAFIDAVANLVDVVVSNYSVRTGAGVVYAKMLWVN